jgi:hypothetical protein
MDAQPAPKPSTNGPQGWSTTTPASGKGWVVQRSDYESRRAEPSWLTRGRAIGGGQRRQSEDGRERHGDGKDGVRGSLPTFEAS